MLGALTTPFASSHSCSHVQDLPEKCHLAQHESCVQKALTARSLGGGGSEVAPTSWDWQAHIHSPPVPSPTPAAFNYPRVNYRPCYDVTGGATSWAGEGTERIAELPLKSKATVPNPHEKQYQREMGDASFIWGKCNQLNWPNFRLTPMGTQHFFRNTFYLYLQNKKHPEGIKWGFCSSEEGVRVTAVHLLIFKKLALLWKLLFISKPQRKVEGGHEQEKMLIVWVDRINKSLIHK